MSLPSASLNHPTSTTLRAAQDKLGNIRSRYQRSKQKGSQKIPYLGEEFETDIHHCLSSWLEYSVLPNIRVFMPSKRGSGELAHELDNIIHLRSGDTDYIIIIEAKAQPITINKGEWQVTYPGAKKPKCARKQVEEHIKTLWEYLEPIKRDTNLKFMAMVVSPDPSMSEEIKQGYRNAEFLLLPSDRILDIIEERFNFKLDANLPHPELFRVSQSPFLDILRLSMPIPSLGHPELSSAIRYVDRCRRVLDQTLFDDFSPKAERWLINGSAGMGKSVLLAYAAVVLSSGRELYRALGDTGVKDAKDVLDVTSYDPSAGPIAMLAMSAKQLENLRFWYGYFVDIFEEKDLSGDIHFRRPEFILARNIDEWKTYKRTFSAVFLDEAHDLPDHAAYTLKEIHDTNPFYLVVACDRHQQLRLSGSDARVMKGFDFSGKWVRLKQIYRNPAPVYIASLALMFRWFSDGGPKVIPPTKELVSSFGFDVISINGEPTLTMKNDAHPANSWAHIVASFPDAATAASTLRREKLGRKDVLWVRFSEENHEFDYESLQHEFTYHNCRNHEAHKLSDKYIKGQDFPVVVIEGFPSFMDRYETEDQEKQMWQFRRELYLCASRATCFLYFVCDVKENSEVNRIRKELNSLLKAVGSPHAPANAMGAKPWTLKISKADKKCNYDKYLDTVTDKEDDTSSDSSSSLKTSHPQDKPSKSNLEAPTTNKSNSPTSSSESKAKPKASETSKSDREKTRNLDTQPDKPSEDIEFWDLTIPEPMTTKEFAELVGVGTYRITQALYELRYFGSHNQPIPIPTLVQIAPKFDCQVVGEDGQPLPSEKKDIISPDLAELGNNKPIVHNEHTVIKKPMKPAKELAPDPRLITLDGPIVVSELAKLLELKPFQLMADLIKLEVFVAPHQTIDEITAARLCHMHKHPHHRKSVDNDKNPKLAKKIDKSENNKEQPAAPQDHTQLREHHLAYSVSTEKKQPPQPQKKASQSEVNQRFALRKGINIRSGLWIKDSKLDYGKIIQLNTGDPGEDSHTVWFYKTKKLHENHVLRGSTKEILHVSKIPQHIRTSAPRS